MAKKKSTSEEDVPKEKGTEDKPEEELEPKPDDEEKDKGEGEDDDKGEDLEQQHKDELAKEKERQERATKKALGDESFKNRKKKRDEDQDNFDDDDEDEDDKPLTGRQLRGILAEERQRTRKELLGSQIAEKARELATSETEAALVVQIHKGRTWPDYLTLDEQLEEALAIANRKRTVAENQELKRSLKSKNTKKRDAATTHQDDVQPDEPKTGADDLHAIKATGFKWNGGKRLYIKPIAGGKKTLYYDPKTKKKWVESN